MLHFGGSGLFWECDTVRLASDMLPVEYSAGADTSYRLPPFSSLGKLIPASASIYTAEWSKIVNIYSTMELSRPAEDKLAACGGVAKVMAELMEDEYVTGFFRRDLVTKLPWTRMDHRAAPSAAAAEVKKSITKRSKTWRAPSWSWASMDGAVSTFSPPLDEETSAQIVALDCKLTDPSNPYGALSSATITLEGWTIEVKIDWSVEDLRASVYRDKDVIEVVLDDVDEPRKNLMILLTMMGKLDPVHLGARRYVKGLVLAPVDNELFGPGRLFRRVGAFVNGRISTEMSQALERRIIEII
jgi:hypothetical protein